jgi:hypothetical protein
MSVNNTPGIKLSASARVAALESHKRLPSFVRLDYISFLEVTSDGEDDRSCVVAYKLVGDRTETVVSGLPAQALFYEYARYVTEENLVSDAPPKAKVEQSE